MRLFYESSMGGNMHYQNRLYQILYPSQALVASQLPPDEFGRHYRFGSHRHYEGKVIFCDVDPTFRHEFFDIEGAMHHLVPHEDGRPKATKYIASYRVLEHVPLWAVGNLYLMTATGNILALSREPYDKQHQSGHLRCFAQICPLNMLVLSLYNAEEYANYITRPRHVIGAPKMFFTQVELPSDDFLADFDRNPFVPAPIPFVHPAKLRDAISEIKMSEGKKLVKGVSIWSDLESISYGQIRHGFWFAAQDETLFFPMPATEQLMASNYPFYRTM